MKTKILALSMLFCAVGAAHAAVIIEPYGGYSVGTLSTTNAATTVSDSSSLNGLGYGARAGFVLHHFVVMTAEYQAVSAKEKFGAQITQTNWTQSTLFATIGFQAPRGFRLLGSFGWDAKADLATTPDVTHYKGTAAKLLVGWHLPTNMAVNVEYSIYKYSDSSLAGVSSKIGDTYSKFDYSAVMATLSFPFEFFHMGHRSSGSSSSSSSSSSASSSSSSGGG